MSEPSKPAISGHPSIRKYGSTFSRFVNTILFGERGLRAGWRLMLFLFIFIASQYALDKTFVHWLLLQHVVSPITGGVLTPAAVLTEDGVAIIGLFTAMAILGKIEGKRLAAYGMPLSRTSQCNFRRGTLWGCLGISVIILGIFAGHGYVFGRFAPAASSIFVYAAVWAIVTFLASVAEELTFRGYAQFT